MSFSVDKHICNDEIYSIAYFGESEICDMEMKTCHMDTEHCMNEPDTSISMHNQNSCCAEIKEIVQTVPFTLAKELDITLTQLQFFTAFTYSFLLNDLLLIKEKNTFHYYKPPRIVNDIPVLYQVFLI